MSTWTDTITYIKTQLKPGVLGNTNVQKILNSVLAVVNQLNAGSIDPETDSGWKPTITYSADVVPVLWLDNWLVSNIVSNTGNIPISNSGIVHPSWRIVGSSSGSGIRIWEAIVYPNLLEIIFYSGGLYYLDREEVGAEAFVSVDFAVELAAGNWLTILPNSTPLANTYADNAAMIAAQGSQESGYFYRSGTSLFIKLATSTGLIADYYDVNSGGDGHTHSNIASLDLVSGTNTGDQDLSGKVDKVAGKSLIDDTEISRLAGINDRFKGKYTTLANLQAAFPTANAGDYAQVDTGAANPVSNYNYDVEDGWVIGSTGGAVIANTDELPEGSSNLYFTGTRVLSTILAGVTFLTNRAIVAGDSILVAIGLLQRQLTDVITSIGTKEDTLVSGTNIKTVNGNTLLGSGDLVIGAVESDFTVSTGNPRFDIPRKYGFTTALTGNITFDGVGAKESVMIKILHNSGTIPVFAGPGGVTLRREGPPYTISVANIIYAVCHKNDAGTLTLISYSVTKAN